jgi:hypothetical protein
MKCKAIGGLIRYLTRVIPDGLLLSIAHVRFTWFNKCKRFAGLNFKCKLEVGLIIKNCQLFSGRGKECIHVLTSNHLTLSLAAMFVSDAAVAIFKIVYRSIPHSVVKQ